MSKKLKKLGLLCVCSTALLAGCKDKDKDEEPKEHPVNTNYVINNITNELTGDTSKTYNPDKKSDTFSKDSIYSNAFESKGLLITKNNQGYIGFYSIFAGKHIISNMLSDNFLNYYITEDPRVGFFIEIFYKNDHMLIDSFGNVLISDVSNVGVNNIYTMIRNDTIYYDITYKLDELYFKIGESNVASKVTVLPEIELIDFSLPLPELNSIYDYNLLPTANFGKNLEGYSVYFAESGDLYTKFEDKIVSRFHLNYDNLVGFIGTSLVCQSKIKLPDDATDYTFSEDGSKYLLTITCNDLTNGKVTTISNPEFYISGSLLPVFDQEKNNIGGYGSIAMIDPKYKVITENIENAFIDDKFNFLFDGGYYSVSNLIKLPNGNYFNPTSKTLFNDELVEICNFTFMSDLSIKTEADGFLGKIDGKYGFVGFDGKIKMEFKYDSIISTVDYKDILVKNEDGFYHVDLEEGTASKLNYNSIVKVTSWCYSATKESSFDIDYISNKGASIFGYDAEEETYTRKIVTNTGTSDSYVLFIKATDTTYTYTYLYNTEAIYKNCITYGTDCDEFLEDGTTSHPYILETSPEPQAFMVGLETNVYFKFAPSRTAYYFAGIEDKTLYCRDTTSLNYVPSVSVDDKRAYLLEENYEYEFYATSFFEPFETHEITLDFAYGINSQIPEMVTTEPIEIPSARSTRYFKANVEAGFYDIKCGDINAVINVNSSLVNNHYYTDENHPLTFSVYSQYDNISIYLEKSDEYQSTSNPLHLASGTASTFYTSSYVGDIVSEYHNDLDFDTTISLTISQGSVSDYGHILINDDSGNFMQSEYLYSSSQKISFSVPANSSVYIYYSNSYVSELHQVSLSVKDGRGSSKDYPFSGTLGTACEYSFTSSETIYYEFVATESTANYIVECNLNDAYYAINSGSFYYLTSNSHQLTNIQAGDKIYIKVNGTNGNRLDLKVSVDEGKTIGSAISLTLNELKTVNIFSSDNYLYLTYANHSGESQDIYFVNNRDVSVSYTLNGYANTLSVDSPLTVEDGQEVALTVSVGYFSGTIKVGVTNVLQSALYSVDLDNIGGNYKWSYNSSSDTYTSYSGLGNSKISRMCIDILTNCTISFDYDISSESNYDFFQVYSSINSSNYLISDSGVKTGKFTHDFTAGERIYLDYSKDGSQNSGRDNVIISNLIASIN